MSELARKHPRPRAAVAKMVEEIRVPLGDQWSLRPGPRQIGKTTSLGHVVQRLVDAGIPPKSIVFVPVDQEGVRQSSADSIDDIVKSCFALHTPTKQAPLYLFLDEIQDLPDWDSKLKAAWDKYHHVVRVMATGSNALQVGKPADFQNRIRVTKMYSMKFREVLEAHPQFSRFLAHEKQDQLFALALRARLAMPGPLGPFNDALEELHTFLHAHAGLDEFLSAIFLEYCVWGGYPSIRPGSERSPAQRLEYMEAAWNNIAGKDLVNTSINKMREFRLLFRQLALNPGTKFVASKIGQDLGVKHETTAEWKRLLETLMLVQQLAPLKPNLSPHGGKDKAYTLDPGWFAYWSTVTDHTTVVTDRRGIIGALVESVLVDHLRRLQYNLATTTALGTGYVDTPEVDAAIELGPRWLLVEAKYRTQPRSNLSDAGKPGDLRIIASREHYRLAEQGGVHHVPAHELALLC